MFTKINILALSLVVTSLVLTGCGEPKEKAMEQKTEQAPAVQPETTVQAQPAETTPAEVKPEGKI